MKQKVLIAILMTSVLQATVGAQAVLPPRLDDLPKLAKDWPPAWAALVHDVVPARAGFERNVMTKLDAVMRAEKASGETFRRADLILLATLRHHRSVSSTAPLADDAGGLMQTELQDRLATLRRDWLNHLRAANETADALRLADAWLPRTPPDSAVRAAILQLWIEQATAAFGKMDYPTARGWLDRIETSFDDAAADSIRKPLHERAEALFKEASAAPDAQAIRALEEALALWPRLPEARDALERKKGTFRTLIVAVRSLPEQLSPATAATVAERQALDLLFDRLVQVEPQSGFGNRYRPQLAESLPGATLAASMPLRRDAYWSTGERLTAADVRHTAHLMNLPDANQRSALWRDYLEMPRLDANRFLVDFQFRQGLLDPLAPLGFYIVPQLVRGKQLDRPDDAAFAKSPVGSGPFQYVGRKVEGTRTFAVFTANPHDLRGSARSLREIRMVAWADPRKDLVKPLPPMILDAPTDQLSALRELGYVELRIGDNPYVNYLAINHRRPTLASAPMRRALAHVIDRQDLLNRHFRAADAKDKPHASANGLFPRSSWATCPAPRVPAELWSAEQALSFARQAKKEMGKVEWTLKYPAGDDRVKRACEDIASAIRALLQTAEIQAKVEAQGLSPRDLRKAQDERDFDLLYTSAAGLDNPVALALFFDPQPGATRAGGSNVLGYDADVKLQALLHGTLQHRQFSAAQTNMHAIHERLYAVMPVVPLWQLDVHVLMQPMLGVPRSDSHDVFARVREWHFSP